jgi:hypothetical protein
MKTYSVKLRYQDRDKGAASKTVNVDASTIAGAIAKAAREFVKGLDRKQRFDGNKGLQLEASRVTARRRSGSVSSQLGYRAVTCIAG